MTDLSNLFLSKNPSELKQMTRDDYRQIVQRERQKFVYQHFAPVLAELFPRLRNDAIKMKRCHHNVLFDCPEHFDVDKIESVIQEYFRDLGFKTIPEPRKNDTTQISLTIV